MPTRTFPNLQPAPKQAATAVDFLVVGGGIAGLSTAIALCRVGHQVTVLENHVSIADQTPGGCRMPPNLSKILFHWGLGAELEEFGLKSEGVDLHVFHRGEKLGRHLWDEEMLRDTRGEFIFCHRTDLRQLLYDVAIHCGAQVRMGVDVTSVDPVTQKVCLSAGEVLQAEVIVGADGAYGTCRKLLLPPEADEPTHRLNLYRGIIPKTRMMGDPELAAMYNQEVGGTEEMSVMIYGPPDGNERSWEQEGSKEGMRALAATGDSRIQKLAALVDQVVCVPVETHPLFEDWVDDSGNFVLVGDAAHPIAPGGIQEAAMALEDAAVLAKLFSHYRTKDQTTTLLNAFQDLRQPRCKRVIEKEFLDLAFMTMPDGENQEGRDNHLRSRRDAGLNVLDDSEENEGSVAWAEIKDVFGYDAEDDADNWWMEWGLLRERARGTDVSKGFVEPVVIEQGVSRFSFYELTVRP